MMTLIPMLIAAFIAVDGNVPLGTDGACDTAAFVKTFNAEKSVKNAKWTLTGCGVFRAYLNGEEVGGEDFLKPGLTHIAKRRHSFTYEVTQAIKSGKNVLAAEVSTGWWRDGVVKNPYFKRGEKSAVDAKLVIEYVDGSKEEIATDTTWKGAYAGKVTHAEIYWGEDFDARVDDSWKASGEVDWQNAVTYDYFKGEVSPVEGRTIKLRRDLTLKPREIYVWKDVEGASGTNVFGKVKILRRYNDGDKITLEPGETLVVDFAQNASGVPEWTLKGDSGTKVTGHPCEMLNDANGERSRGNDGPAGSAYIENYRHARSLATYVCNGNGSETYLPHFSFFGGRYWSITATGKVEFEKISYVPLMSIAPEDECGKITTGRDDLNQLISNCIWGMRSNYLSVPTDCPQRNERLGWAGDTQAFCGAAVYAADVYGFLSKWMTDMRDSVLGPNEKFPGSFRRAAPIGPAGCLGYMIGWSDAGIIVPYTLWKHYGNTAIVKQNWKAMSDFMDLLVKTYYVTPISERQCADWLSDEAYENWRIYNGKGLKNGETIADMRAWWDMLGEMYHIWDMRMMSEMADAIGYKEAANAYRSREKRFVDHFRKNFLNKEGLLPERYHGMQTPAAFVLKLGLNPTASSRAKTIEMLKKSFKDRHYRISTGFLGTSIIMDVLADSIDDPTLAYNVLLNHKCPGWLYSVDQGATTIWERWDGYRKDIGFGPVSMNSFNHYSYGAVMGWMYRTMAGIRPGKNGGFKEFILKPATDRRIGSCSASLKTSEGVIKSEWKYNLDGSVTWNFTIPEGTSAEVFAPGAKTAKKYVAGNHTLTIKKAEPMYPTWVSKEEWEFLTKSPVTGYDFTVGAPEGDAKRFYYGKEGKGGKEFVEFNYDETKAGVLGKDYTLEDPLTFVDGSKVKTPADWQKRRQELLKIFEQEVYGKMPPKPETEIIDLVSEKLSPDFLTIERRYRMYFRPDRTGPVINWMVLIPAHAKKPCPVIVQLNYRGNDAVMTFDNSYYKPPFGELTSRGYALINAQYTEITSDGKEGSGYFDGVCELWGPRDFSKPDNPGAIMVWAWGMSRGLDLAEKLPELDAKRSVATGSSRLGKTALVAAAFDERFAVCVPNQTGAVGVQLMKRDYGETLKGQIHALPHWYCNGAWKWMDEPRKMPFDQHLLLACVAPRALLLECYHKKWFDPRGEWLAAKAASPAWEFLTGKGIKQEEWPAEYSEDLVKPPFGFVRRTERHGLSSYDWKWVMDFADQVFAEQKQLDAEAQFIMPAKENADCNVAVFEKKIVNSKPIAKAEWELTAQGVFEAFVNDKMVGNDFLKPGNTSVEKCRHLYRYDVTSLLKLAVGEENLLTATVSPTWWSDAIYKRNPKVKYPWKLGEKPAFRAVLKITYADGSVERVKTDTTWLSSYSGPVRYADLYHGECYDAREIVKELAPSIVNTEFTGEFREAEAKITLREDLQFKPVAITVYKGADGAIKDKEFGKAIKVRSYNDGDVIALNPEESLVIDFAQNASAEPVFEVEGEAGTEIHIRHAEMLNDANGEKSRGNDGPAGIPYLESLRSARAEIKYTLKDGAQTYMPRYTFFGYRYLLVKTTAQVRFKYFKSIPVSSVTKAMEGNRIITGDKRVNRLISNVYWGMLSNYISIPTDCPQRDERLGWTADTQVFMNTGLYSADIASFLGKYLADMRDGQYPNGLFTCFVPNVRHVFRPWASCGWTDAGVIIPYRLWKWTGDVSYIDMMWDSMSAYMDFLRSNTKPYQIDHCDWLAYEHRDTRKGADNRAQDPAYKIVMNAYFHPWMARLMSEMARATGRNDYSWCYTAEAQNLEKAFRDQYIGEDGCIKDYWKGQCNDLYMLKLGYVKGAAKEATINDLVNNIREHGNRLQTGFLGTSVLMPTLSFEANRPDVAYDLLFQDQDPSWLYSVDQGATTIWERWNSYTKAKGFGAKSMNSFNHYAYGCVVEWLYSAVAGIRQESDSVGWKKPLLAPLTDRRLGSCDAQVKTPVGTFKSAWKYDEAGKLTWSFTIPAGSSAKVIAPGKAPKIYAAGSYTLSL